MQVPYRDTWEWRADAGWRHIDVPGPGILDHTQMAYDPSRQQAVLFGGQRDLNTFPDEIWTFDGDQWTALPGAGPGSRVHHAMQYHPGLGGVVMFGGFEPGASDRGDTWRWNGAWAEIAPARAPRTHARMAYDEHRAALVLVGGSQPPTSRSCSAMPDGNPWVCPAHPAALPPGRGLRPGARVLVVFGGGDPSSNALRVDTWELDSVGWRRVD